MRGGYIGGISGCPKAIALGLKNAYDIMLVRNGFSNNCCAVSNHRLCNNDNNETFPVFCCIMIPQHY